MSTQFHTTTNIEIEQLSLIDQKTLKNNADQKQPDPDSKDESQRSNNCFLCIATSIILIMFILISMYIINTKVINVNESHGSNNNINNYVLPNTTLIVSTNSTTTIKGQFIVDQINYNFVSISNNTMEYIEFLSVSKMVEWVGFKIYHLNETKLIFQIISNTEVNTIVSTQNDTLHSADISSLELFLGDILCEHFVELSVKLAALGYLGNMNHAIQDIHRFAQWMWNIADKDDNINTKEWVDITEEFEKVNAIHAASKSAGFWVNNMNELILYSSHMYSKNTNDRTLLETCGSPSTKCDNDCFGMCGPQCWCWSWVCGDCQCWKGCYDHDYHCSCEGYWNWCCLNFFWVRCDGSGSC